MTHLAGGVLLKIQKDFEIMLSIFEISRGQKIKNLDWSMVTSFYQSTNHIS